VLVRFARIDGFMLRSGPRQALSFYVSEGAIGFAIEPGIHELLYRRGDCEQKLTVEKGRISSYRVIMRVSFVME